MPDYDKLKRDPAARAFYNSAGWKRCRAGKLAETPWCEYVAPGAATPCGNPAQHVHHVTPIATPEGWDKRLDRAGLQSLCIPHHNKVEAIGPPMPAAAGSIELVENERYYYDAEAADRACRFIETFCVHADGPCGGKPFELLGWQGDLVRTIFGWKHRDTGLRRFREVYLLTAKGAGKTPLLAAIGLFMLLGDGEIAPHVISLASTFEQASLTFGGAKGYILKSPQLRKHATVLDRVIRTRKDGKWTTVSGKNNGRSGPRPSCIIADECHEWTPATGEGFGMLCANLFKRQQPLLMVATNAGNSRTSFAWGAHERAIAVLSGKIVNDALLPIIYEAPSDLPWDSEAAAAASNPSLGMFVKWEQLAPALALARSNAFERAKYERLYLSRWVTGSANRWLNVPEQWTPCVAEFDPAKLDGAVLYVGLDLSLVDDLSAAALVYVTPDHVYIDSRFWLPRDTAEIYEKKNAVPFSEWAAGGFIELLDEPTISSPVHKRIAAQILELGTIEAMCYDRFRSDEIVSILQAAGVKCERIAQGYTLSPAVAELSRRLTERTVTIRPNPVLDWNAENVELTSDRRGNTWPVKPRATTGYAGSRFAKVDGIVAAVTALVKAREHFFPAEVKEFKGSIYSIEI